MKWKLVPEEPTSEMLDAMDSSAWRPWNYKRMLAVAPQPEHDRMTKEEAREFQDWKYMDGAIAFHLIERHAEGWNPIGATNNVLSDVSSERSRQRDKWDGVFNDDNYTPFDWHEMIADYNGWARRMACMGSDDKARTRYIQIAALAVAAVEALDRRSVK
jgi:hypothetical protein